MNFVQLPTNQLLGALVIALLAALVKYISDRQLAERKDRLDRTNQQLQLLYGPLYALSHAGAEAWNAFRSMYGANRLNYWESGLSPSNEEVEAWRLWMQDVFMPINERIEALIIEHADLLEEQVMPPCLLDLCAHVEAYRGVLKEWETGNYSHNTSVINYPIDVRLYAAEHFAALKERQTRLLAHKPSRGNYDIIVPPSDRERNFRNK